MTERVQVLVDGVLLPSWREAALQDADAIAWQGERIVAVGSRDHLRRRFPQAEETPLHGRLVTPGLVNAHHHIYSALASGLDPGMPLRNFDEVLRGLWWRLDRALDEDCLRLSARLTALRALRSGCTGIVDHHSSPSCIGGSLDLIGEELQASGLRAVLCYEVSDRGGPAEARAGCRENLRFASEQDGSPQLRGMMGLHASFTLSEDSLRACRQGIDRWGAHLHVAEDPLDERLTRARYGSGLLERLERHGILSSRSLLVHGVHLQPDQLDELRSAGVWLALNPESNANNQVGLPDLDAFADLGLKLLLGTDGMGSDMLAALRAAFLLQRSQHGNAGAGWRGVRDLLAANQLFIAERFGDTSHTGLQAGARAEFVVWDHVPGTAPGVDSLPGHLLYGVTQAPVRHLVAGGRWLLRNHQLLSVDEDALAGELRRARPQLERRFGAMPPLPE